MKRASRPLLPTGMTFSVLALSIAIAARASGEACAEPSDPGGRQVRER